MTWSPRAWVASFALLAGCGQRFVPAEEAPDGRAARGKAAASFGRERAGAALSARDGATATPTLGNVRAADGVRQGEDASPVAGAASQDAKGTASQDPKRATAAEPAAEAGALVELDVPAFAPAAVAIPSVGEAPHRVAVVAHGNFDRASWECAFWQRLLPESFVLCLGGELRADSPSPDDPRYTYRDSAALERELDTALEVFAARFGARADSGTMLWAGLSRGAFLGAELAPRRPARFPALILVEGGHDPWTFVNAKAFADGGGKRVQFVCGQRSCTLAAQSAARRLERFGVATRVDEVPGMGHGLSDGVDPFVAEALPWLRAGAVAPPP